MTVTLLIRVRREGLVFRERTSVEMKSSAVQSPFSLCSGVVVSVLEGMERFEGYRLQVLELSCCSDFGELVAWKIPECGGASLPSLRENP